MEDQAFSPSNDLARPPPLPPFPASKLDRSCDGEKAWSPINHSVLSALYVIRCYIEVYMSDQVALWTSYRCNRVNEHELENISPNADIFYDIYMSSFMSLMYTFHFASKEKDINR